jgi:hypothetical protein
MNTMRYFIFFFLLGSSLFAYTVRPYIKSESLIEFKSNQSSNPETPFYQYLTFDYNQKNISILTDMGAYAEPYYSEGDFHLYNGSITLKKLGNVLDISGGRFTLLHGFNVDTVDGGEIAIHFNDYLTLRTFGGVLRFLDESDFIEGNFITGASLALENYKNNYLAFHFEYEQDKDSSDYYTRLGLGYTHYFAAATTPEIYSNVEVEASYGTLNEGTLGIRFYPSIVIFDSSASYYDTPLEITSKDLDIFRTTTAGPMYVLNQEITVIPHEYISIFANGEFSDYDYDTAATNYGYALTTGFDFHDTSYSRRIEPAFFYTDSFGGTFYGVRLTPLLMLIKRISIRLPMEVLQFEKVTSEEGIAFSQEVSALVTIFQGFSINVKGEYNSNDEFKNDVRGFIGVTYEYF